MNKSMLSLAGTLALTAALAATPPAMAAGGVSGDWKIDGSINQVTINITCTLHQAGGKLTGTCRGQDITGDLPLTGDADGKTASWSYNINYQGQQLTVEYHGTLKSAAQMQGTIGVMGDDSGSFTGKRL